MSNPSIDATQQESNTPADSITEPTLEDKLATAEQRRKDTQASYTKGQQANKALEAENAKLIEQLSKETQVVLSAEEQASMDALMYEDPVAWRDAMNKHEVKAKAESKAKIDELTGEAKAAAGTQFELSRRQEVLKEFNESAEVAITEEVIANDVPPRISNKLANGKITFEEYLTEVSDYISKGKVVANETTLDQPNMGKMGGGDTPSDMKPAKSLSGDYKGDIY